MIESPIGSKADFIAGLDLDHIKGDKWVANTPNGRRMVTASTASFREVIYYKTGERILATEVPGLRQMTQDRVIPVSHWSPIDED